MGIKFNGREIGGMMYNGREIESAMINGRLVWPEPRASEGTYLELTYNINNGISYVISCPPNQNGLIDWGDGSISIITGVGKRYAHDSQGGVVTISGPISSFRMDGAKSQLYDISSDSKFGSLVTDFSYCFQGCSRLESIPENLFVNSINATSFLSCFSDCSALASIPEKLFANCVNATNFGSCFYGCNWMYLTSIPENLFANCINAYNFNHCFLRCSALASIPEKLFDNCINATCFLQCFYWCSEIKSKVPELWLRKNPGLYGGECYFRCAYAKNYSSIPKKWK